MRYGFKYSEKLNAVFFHCVFSDLEDFGEQANIFERYQAAPSTSDRVGKSWEHIASEAQSLFSERVDSEVNQLIKLLALRCLVEAGPFYKHRGPLKDELEELYGQFLSIVLDVNRGAPKGKKQSQLARNWSKSTLETELRRAIKEQDEDDGPKNEDDLARRMRIPNGKALQRLRMKKGVAPDLRKFKRDVLAE